MILNFDRNRDIKASYSHYHRSIASHSVIFMVTKLLIFRKSLLCILLFFNARKRVICTYIKEHRLRDLESRQAANGPLDNSFLIRARILKVCLNDLVK